MNDTQVNDAVKERMAKYHKGARFSGFARDLCQEHAEAWCKLHGIDLAAKLAENNE